MIQLSENMVYTFGVHKINHAQESFVKRPSGATAYCHYITMHPMNIEGDEMIEAQICNEHQRLDYFNEGATIKCRVTKFAKGRYTVSFTEVVKAEGYKAGAVTNEPVYQDIPSAPVSSSGANAPVYNPNIMGTIADRSLSHAVHLHHMQGGVKTEDVVATAEVFYNYLKGKL